MKSQTVTFGVRDPKMNTVFRLLGELALDISSHSGPTEFRREEPGD
jgi:hypothetical protein